MEGNRAAPWMNSMAGNAPADAAQAGTDPYAHPALTSRIARRMRSIG
jgi:hypothetical protein